MLMNIKMPTIVGHFNMYEHDKFHAQLRWAQKRFNNFRPLSGFKPLTLCWYFWKMFLAKLILTYRSINVIWFLHLLHIFKFTSDSQQTLWLNPDQTAPSNCISRLVRECRGVEIRYDWLVRPGPISFRTSIYLSCDIELEYIYNSVFHIW